MLGRLQRDSVGTEGLVSMKERLDLTGFRILIADDELLCAMVLEEELTDMGGEIVGTVSSVGDIVETAKRGKADIAVLDVNLKGQLSYEAALELMSDGVAVVFMTGYDHLVNCPEALKAAPLLIKPWTSEMLGETLSGVLAQKR